MKNTFLKTIGTAALAILMTVIFSQIRVSAQEIFDNEQTETQKPVETQKPESFFRDNGARSLEGSWNSTVTFRNCQTGAALATFPAMNTFMRGGTMQEFGVASGFLRGPGHGVWSHDAGRFFLNAFQFFRFNADNTPNGRVVARKQIEVLSRNQIEVLLSSYTATTRIEFYNNDGNLVGQGCATETATRFQ